MERPSYKNVTVLMDLVTLVQLVVQFGVADIKLAVRILLSDENWSLERLDGY